jgi:hypothetical protein
MATPNAGSLDIGLAQRMDIPVWAERPFSLSPVNPIQMYGASRLMAFGAYGAMGRNLYPWRKGKISRGANKVAQGNMMLYSPVGSGSSQ